MSQAEKPNAPLPVQRLGTNGHAPSHSPGALMVPPSAMLQMSNGEPKHAGPPALSAPPNAKTLWCAFRRRWLIAVSAGLVAAIAAVVGVVLFVPGRYTADALIMVNPPSNAQDLNESAMDLKTFRENQQAIIKSSPVLNAALNKPELRALPAVQGQVDAVAWLRGRIKVDFNEGPSIMRLSASGGNAEEVKVIVNAIATAFVTEAQQGERIKAKAELEGLKRTLQDVQTGMQKKEQELAKLLVLWNIPDPTDLERHKESKRKGLDLLNDNLRKIEYEESKVNAKLQSLHNQKKELPTKVVSTYAVDEYLKDDDGFKKLKQQLQLYSDELPRLKLKYQEPLASDYAADYKKHIADLESLVQVYRDKQEDKVRQKQLGKIEIDIADNGVELAGIKQQKDHLTAASEKLKTEIKDIETRQIPKEVANLVIAIQSEKGAYSKLQDKYALVQARLSMPLAVDGGTTTGGNISILQLAETPQALDLSRQTKVAGGVGLGMFLCVLLGVALLEFRSRKINGVEDVTHGLNLPLLGTVPALPDRIRKPNTQPPSPRDLYWHSLLTESIDAIRTVLLHSAREDGSQVVMVTSAASGEGKTSLASHLAASLARAWKKTLLIDGDLRNPAAHKVFGQSLEPGFSDLLRGEVNLENAVHPTSLSRLWLMPAGNWDNHAVQALAQDGLKTIFDQLKEEYDFIIVDSSPVLPVADALQLGQHMDAVVFAILCNVSRAGAVYAAEQRLARLGIHTLGAVMLGAEVAAGAYPYALRSSN